MTPLVSSNFYCCESETLKVFMIVLKKIFVAEVNVENMLSISVIRYKFQKAASLHIFVWYYIV